MGLVGVREEFFGCFKKSGVIDCFTSSRNDLDILIL